MGKEFLPNSASKSEELTYLRRFVASLGDRTYLAGFLTGDLAAELDYRINNDLPCDILGDLRQHNQMLMTEKLNERTRVIELEGQLAKVNAICEHLQEVADRVPGLELDLANEQTLAIACRMERDDSQEACGILAKTIESQAAAFAELQTKNGKLAAALRNVADVLSAAWLASEPAATETLRLALQPAVGLF